MMDAEDFLDSAAADEFLDGKRDVGELLDEIGEALAAMVKAMESGASDSAQTAKALDQMLVVRKTGLSSDGSGIVTITDALLVPGTSYVYEIDLSAASLGRRLPVGVAA